MRAGDGGAVEIVDLLEPWRVRARSREVQQPHHDARQDTSKRHRPSCWSAFCMCMAVHGRPVLLCSASSARAVASARESASSRSTRYSTVTNSAAGCAGIAGASSPVRARILLKTAWPTSVRSATATVPTAGAHTYHGADVLVLTARRNHTSAAMFSAAAPPSTQRSSLTFLLMSLVLSASRRKPPERAWHAHARPAMLPDASGGAPQGVFVVHHEPVFRNRHARRRIVQGQRIRMCNRDDERFSARIFRPAGDIKPRPVPPHSPS